MKLRPPKREPTAREIARTKLPANVTRASLRGDDMADPARADRLLRRFSFEDEPTGGGRP